MATDAQIRANRENAQHSTGPRTEEGKANSCRNNTHWGFRGKFTVLPSESQEEFDSLYHGLLAEHRPQCTTEEMLILKMAQHFWLSQRAQRCLDLSLDPDEPHYAPERLFPLFLRYLTTNDRGYHKCLDQLLKIRAERFKSAIGFERENREAEAHQNRERQRAERMNHAVGHESRRAERHKLAMELAEARVEREKLLNAALDPTNLRLKNLQKAA